jgi:DNA polymerase (family 10)
VVAVDPSITHATEEKVGPVTLHTCPASRFGSVLLHATGSERHVAQLANIAQTKRLSLSAEAMRRGGRSLSTPREQDVYKALDLAFIPPELREGADQIDSAREGVLADLVTMKDLRGVLHLHTDFSDGVNTLEEMAEAARDRGYSYFGRRRPLTIGALRWWPLTGGDQGPAFNGRCAEPPVGRFRILKGIESDILADGALDYPPEVLARFDFVVASVHGRFRLDRAEQTRRILTAVANPYTTILGHLTGRQLLRRPGYDVDVEVILKACAKHGVVVEINSNPWRLELDWRWHRKALDFGCMLSINPDAHSIAELELVQWGVAIARKGGVPKEKVLNALSLKQMLAHLERRITRQKTRPARRLAAQPA